MFSPQQWKDWEQLCPKNVSRDKWIEDLKSIWIPAAPAEPSLGTRATWITDRLKWGLASPHEFLLPLRTNACPAGHAMELIMTNGVIPSHFDAADWFKCSYCEQKQKFMAVESFWTCLTCKSPETTQCNLCLLPYHCIRIQTTKSAAPMPATQKESLPPKSTTQAVMALSTAEALRLKSAGSLKLTDSQKQILKHEREAKEQKLNASAQAKRCKNFDICGQFCSDDRWTDCETCYATDNMATIS